MVVSWVQMKAARMVRNWAQKKADCLAGTKAARMVVSWVQMKAARMVGSWAQKKADCSVEMKAARMVRNWAQMMAATMVGRLADYLVEKMLLVSQKMLVTMLEIRSVQM
jgi:hypothetical protein